MKRSSFLGMMGGAWLLHSLGDLQRLADLFKGPTERMPAMFIGHGSPMNGIEQNSYSNKWREIASKIPTPKAVICISAHWLTKGTFITAMDNPKTIHDFGGFPRELFEVNYPAPGSPELAKSVVEQVSHPIHLDHDWGLDHGTWTVVRHMFPEANVPVLQLSIDYNQPPGFHYELGKKLTALRNQGVLLIGSGNMVHNLGMVAWDKLNTPFGFDWANEMNSVFKEKIGNNEHEALVNYTTLHSEWRKAIPTPDHYYPLLYTLGHRDKSKDIVFFNDEAVAGSLTMTSVLFS